MPSSLNTMDSIKFEQDFRRSLKSLMCFRVLFAVLMTGSALLFRVSENLPSGMHSFSFIYGLAGFILFLSLIYAVIFRYIKDDRLFAAVQITSDTMVVSAVIYLTGSFSSIFNFLYLVVIIYSSFFLFRKGSMITALLCSLQYGLLVGLEYYDVLKPAGIVEGGGVEDFEWSLVLYKILITMAACLAVAFLSSLLAEQERKTKRRLFAMEDHVKRVEQLAAIGKMAAALAHEIKNPLASLSGSIQLLKEDLTGLPEHERLMNIALREANRLGTLVSDFLLFAKPQAGKTELIELDKALTDIVEIFKKHAACQGRITIHKKFSPGISIKMDRTHLYQILWNLLINAAEAIEGKGEIGIELKPLDHHQAAVEISDSGCGMSSEQIRSIFYPFFTTKTNGTGLGLSIVHRILESYNHCLEVSSEIGQGTTFTLIFNHAVSPE